MIIVASPAWTFTDDDRLRKLAISGRSADEIALELKRSVSAIRARAHRLGVSLKLRRTTK